MYTIDHSFFSVDKYTKIKIIWQIVALCTEDDTSAAADPEVLARGAELRGQKRGVPWGVSK